METIKTVKNYELISLIGKGGHGKVYKAVRVSDGKIIALKVIDTSRMTKENIKNVDDEVKALKMLSFPECHPFIVCYYNSYHDKKNNQYLIEMEYIEGKDAFDFVQNKALNKKDLYYYLLLIARDISVGLDYIHEKGIIHNDVKLENVVVENKTYIPKLIDFGLTCDSIGKPNNKYCIKYVGTPHYISPEFFMPSGLKLPASDMWALGVALYQGATDLYMFSGDDTGKIFKNIKQGNIPKLETSNELLNNIVNGLVVRNPKDRLTASQVVSIIDRNNKNIIP